MMNYSELRNTLKTGDVVAIGAKLKPKSIAGWLVRLFTQSEYSHVGIVWIYHGRVFVLESVHPVVRLVPFSELLPAYVVKMEKDLGYDAIEYGFSQIGTGKYSVIEAIKSYFGLNRVNEQIQCVEYVKTILKNNGVEVVGKDTPSELILELQKLGKELIFVEKG